MRKGGRRFQRKTRIECKIPSASLADIAFLFFIFFAVSTAFRGPDYVGAKPVYPQALATKKVQGRPRDIVHLWIVNGNVFLHDVAVPVEQIASRLTPLVAGRPELIVTVRADRSTEFAIVNRVLDQLRAAGVARVSFTTERKPAS